MIKVKIWRDGACPACSLWAVMRDAEGDLIHREDTYTAHIQNKEGLVKIEAE